MPTWFSWQNAIAGLSVILSFAAIVISWNTATNQTYRQQVEARISNCAAVANSYASQSWAYGASENEPDRDLEEFAHKANAIGRAAQLCRNQFNSDVGELRICVGDLVDNIDDHKVSEVGRDGELYHSLVC